MSEARDLIYRTSERKLRHLGKLGRAAKQDWSFVKALIDLSKTKAAKPSSAAAGRGHDLGVNRKRRLMSLGGGSRPSWTRGSLSGAAGAGRGGQKALSWRSARGRGAAATVLASERMSSARVSSPKPTCGKRWSLPMLHSNRAGQMSFRVQ